MRLFGRAAVVTALVAAACTVGGTASAGSERGAGYVWANNPTSASYTPHLAYQTNTSAFPAPANTITRSSTGVYVVRFTDLGASGGVAHATAYGATTNQCKVGSWYPSGGHQFVVVRCLTLAGAPVDSMFTASFTNLRSWAGFDYGATYPGAYVWANNPTAANYTPSTGYQYNSSGATNTVSRLGTGTYSVWLPSIGTAVTGGYPLVTAYGAGGERCKVFNHGWASPSSTIKVNIRCFDTAGSPADTLFTMTFTDRTNIFGAAGCCNPNGHRSAYALAHDDDAASYTPASAYRHALPSATPTATRSGVGDYRMSFPSMDLTTGTVHVQATGWDPGYCTVSGWSASGISVRCHDASGAAVDTPYEVSYTGPWLLG